MKNMYTAHAAAVEQGRRLALELLDVFRAEADLSVYAAVIEQCELPRLQRCSPELRRAWILGFVDVLSRAYHEK